MTNTPQAGQPYQRCDVNCVKLTTKRPIGDRTPSMRYQPNHVDVDQALSDLTYEIWNTDYYRTDRDCVLVTETSDCGTNNRPDIKDGWNADFRRTDVNCDPYKDEDGNEIPCGWSEKYVTQSVYDKRNVLNIHVEYEPYNRGELYPVVTTEPTEVSESVYDWLYLGIEQSANQSVQLEQDRTIVEFEDNTEVDPYYI